MDADEVAVTRVIAVAGPVSADMIAERLRSDVATVRDTVARLGGRALVVEVDGSLVLPELLTQQFAAELQHLRPLAAVVKQALVADLQTAVDGLGGDSHGLIEARLAERLTALLGDPQVVARAVAALPPDAREQVSARQVSMPLRGLAVGVAVTFIGMAWLSRLSADTPYVTGPALPMVLLGIGQGASLGPLTAAGIARVTPDDAGAASGLVNVSHQLGGSLGLGILVTVFAAASSPTLTGSALLAHQVSAALSVGAGLLALALVVVLALIVAPGRRAVVPSR